MRRFSWLLLTLALLPGSSAPAVDRPPRALGDEALDDRVDDALRRVIREGVEHYKADRLAECAAVFQGGLVAVQSFLQHRPNLQDAIRKGLASAEQETSSYQRAWALRQVIDKVRTTVKPPPMAGAGDTLWDRLGGERNVRRIVSDFVDSALKDPKVNFSRNGKYRMDAERVADLKHKIVMLTSAIGKGPFRYEGKSMKEAHKGMNITDTEFDALLPHLRIALLSNGVKPADVDYLQQAISLVRKDIVGDRGGRAPMEP